MFTKGARVFGGLMLVLSFAALSTGCKSHKDDIQLPPDLTKGGGGPGGAPGDQNKLPDISADTLFSPMTENGVKPIYFDYNSFALRPDAIQTLTANVEKIRQYAPTAVIQVEGHCDDRGTQEYNLALGEKRALATREQMIKLGIAADHIITISYGEEKPAVVGTGEAVWSKNRRCEFNKAM